MAQQRHGAYDENGVCTRTWYEEIPDPPAMDADADATVPALETADATALSASLATAVTVAQVKAVVVNLVKMLST